MSVLITGGTGFLGLEIAKILIEDGEHVVLFDLYPDANAVAGLGVEVTIVRRDFSEAADVVRVFSEHDISQVVHLAYLIADLDSSPAQAIRVNCAGTNLLFEAAIARGVQRTVWASSAAACGVITTSTAPRFVTEDDGCLPYGMYSTCKLFNEGNAEALARRSGFDHIALRLPATYGRRRETRRGLAPDFLAVLFAKAGTGETIPAPPADHVVTWSYVTDVARAFHVALRAERPSRRIYNVPGVSATVAEGVAIVADLAPGTTVEHRPTAEVHLAYLNGDRIAADLGFRPHPSLRESFADCLAGGAA
jgi:UDP-glucose 4-epimerase